MSKYSYCETLAASGPWHIRELSDKGHFPSGGADTFTLCGMQAAWDVGVTVPFSFRPASPEDGRQAGRTCRVCSDEYEEIEGP